MTWTYFFRRLLKNPSYYNLESVEPQDVNYYLSNLVQSSLDALANANCLEIEEVSYTFNYFIYFLCVYHTIHRIPYQKTGP